jgi:hypothetical protein|tara:strand:+ start:351 stop:647 length:297 start_codon:yes stop_codon:yes gene_type:complete
MNINTQNLAPYKITNYVTSPRKMTFEYWLDSPVTHDDCRFDSILLNRSYTHKRFIQDFINDLKEVINNSGYAIENEKQFKNEVATFIYRLSREPKYAN